jgi:hypothetical protein
MAMKKVGAHLQSQMTQKEKQLQRFRKAGDSQFMNYTNTFLPDKRCCAGLAERLDSDFPSQRHTKAGPLT